MKLLLLFLSCGIVAIVNGRVSPLFPHNDYEYHNYFGPYNYDADYPSMWNVDSSDRDTTISATGGYGFLDESKESKEQDHIDQDLYHKEDDDDNDHGNDDNDDDGDDHGNGDNDDDGDHKDDNDDNDNSKSKEDTNGSNENNDDDYDDKIEEPKKPITYSMTLTTIIRPYKNLPTSDDAQAAPRSYFLVNDETSKSDEDEEATTAHNNCDEDDDNDNDDDKKSNSAEEYTQQTIIPEFELIKQVADYSPYKSDVLNHAYLENQQQFNGVVKQFNINVHKLVSYVDEMEFMFNTYKDKEYNGQDHKEFGSSISSALTQVDTIRSTLMEMQNIEKHQNYQHLLMALIKELYEN